jgi:hypothetical protein
VYPVVVSDEWEILKENDKSTKDLSKFDKMNQYLVEIGFPYFESGDEFEKYYSK